MSEINDLTFPETLFYSNDHEWVKLNDDNTIYIGITDYAQDQLGDIVFVELPEIGKILNKGDELCTVESVKSVSEIYMPVYGEIIAVNTDLDEAPELVNKSSYDKGWFTLAKINDKSELDKLLNKTQYLNMLRGI